MIILIDIGNSRTKYRIVDEIRSSPITAVTNALIDNEYLSKYFTDACKVIVASVSEDKLANSINRWCQTNDIAYRQVISEMKKNKVINAYQQPNQLGVDRWLALVGAAELFPNKNVLIIDAGTATTVDLLASSGKHQGGWILAGVTTLISSVLSQTVHVQANDTEKESLSFGFNTSQNVHNAARAATVGAINLAISHAQQQGLVLDEVILTGGNGMSLSTLLSYQNKVQDDLVLRGLQAYI